MLTSNYQAEYGRAGGGFIALTTRGGTSELPRRRALLPPPRQPERQHLLQQRARRLGSRVPAPALPLQLLRLGSRRPGAVRRHQGRPQAVLLRGPGVLRPAGAAGRVDQHPRAHGARARRQLLAERRRHRQADHDRRSADRPAVPRQHHPGRTASTLRARRSSTCLPTPNTTAGGNVYNYTSQVPEQVSAPRGHRRVSTGRSSNRHASQRALGLQLRRPAVRLRHDHRVLELAADRHRAQERTRHDALVHADPQLQPDADRTSSSTAPAAAASRSRPTDDKATRAATGINTPLLYPERQHRQPDPEPHLRRHRQRVRRRSTPRCSGPSTSAS